MNWLRRVVRRWLGIEPVVTQTFTYSGMTQDARAETLRAFRESKGKFHRWKYR